MVEEEADWLHGGAESVLILRNSKDWDLVPGLELSWENFGK